MLKNHVAYRLHVSLRWIFVQFEKYCNNHLNAFLHWFKMENSAGKVTACQSKESRFWERAVSSKNNLIYLQNHQHVLQIQRKRSPWNRHHRNSVEERFPSRSRMSYCTWSWYYTLTEQVRISQLWECNWMSRCKHWILKMLYFIKVWNKFHLSTDFMWSLSTLFLLKM